MARRLVNGKRAIRALKRVLSKPDHPQYGALYKFMAEQGYGKATQQVDVNARDMTLEQLLGLSGDATGADPDDEQQDDVDREHQERVYDDREEDDDDEG
jgi:hypothetical protein